MVISIDFTPQIISILFYRHTSELEKKVLRSMFYSKKDLSVYDVEKAGLSHSNAVRIIRKLMRNNLIEVSGTRTGVKDKKQEFKVYRLTEEGLSTLIHPYYSRTKELKDRELKELVRIFITVKEKYPTVLPEPFRSLPPEYSVAFYPIISSSQLISTGLRKLLEAKHNKTDRSEFLIENECFSVTVPLTKKEETIISEYLSKSP